MNTKTLITYILVLFFLASCASNQGKNQNKYFENYIEKNQLPSLSKIRTFKMINWSSLDNKHLLLSSHHNKKYLITLASYCSDLKHVNSISLKQSMEYSLSAKFDSVIVIGHHHNQECKIQKIHELNKQQAKEILALR
jgi:PBP1b-binding outer membrane lipoprotein LpoB